MPGMQILPQIPSTYINVKSYGATGNGTSDDSAAIAAAINAVSATGGTVFFPPGTYITSLITWPTKVWLKGSGYTATIIQLKNAQNTDLIRSTNFATLVGTNSSGGIYNGGIMDLTLDGNKSGQSSGTGRCLSVYGYGYTIQNVRMRNAFGMGAYTEWAVSPNDTTAADADAMEAVWDNVKVHDNGLTGIYANGPHDSHFHNVWAFVNGTTAATDTNLFVGPSVTNLNLAQCHFWSGTVNYAANISGGIIASGCYFEGGIVGEVQINIGYIVMTDCYYFSGGIAGTKGIVFENSATNCFVTGQVEGCDSGMVDMTNAADRNHVVLSTHSSSAANPGVVGGTGTNSVVLIYQRTDSANSANSLYMWSGQTLIIPATASQVPFVVQGQGSQTADLIQVQNSTPNTLWSVDVNGRVYRIHQTAPTAAAGGNAGSGPPSPVVTSGDTDERGKITFGTGTGPSAGAQVTVTFGHTFSNATPYTVVVPLNTATQALGLYISAMSATAFTVSTTSAPAASQGNTVYGFYYITLG